MNITALTMPKLGLTMTVGVVSEWMIEPGSAVSKGDVVVTIENDKAISEVEAETGGVLRRILVGDGEEAEIGALIGVIASQKVSESEIEEFAKSFKP